jgi:hypothetical protein
MLVHYLSVYVFGTACCCGCCIVVKHLHSEMKAVRQELLPTAVHSHAITAAAAAGAQQAPA